MIDFGTVRPGTTLYIPFATYDSNDPSASVTLTGLATTDIEVYKNGSVTQRASDSGYALLDTDGIDFDGTTGIHGISINLADNTTAGFWEAGAQYTVVIASITVDAATVNFIAATFRIGYSDAILNTTIATLASQTSFTLTSGPAENDALNGCVVCIHDVASAVQFGYAVISDYTGSTKTVTLAAGVTFTAAATDNISVFPPANMQYLGSSPQSATDLKDFADAGYDPATNKVQGVVLVDTLTTYTSNTPQTGDVYALANGATGFAAIDTVVDAIKVKTDFLPSATAGSPGGLFIAGTNAATTVTTSFTTEFNGSLTGSVNGNVVGNVGSIDTGGIVASSFAAGAIDAAAIASDAVTKIQAGLAVAGDQMDLVAAPNATAITAIQNGLATPTNITAGTIASVTNGVTLANGAITDASLAGNMEIVFETDFATNYNATRNAWSTNVQDFVGTSAADPFNGQVVAASVTGNVGGNVVGTVASVLGGINTSAGTITTLDGLNTAQDTQHGTTQTAIADVPTNAEFNARTIPSTDYFDPATDTVDIGAINGSTLAAIRLALSAGQIIPGTVDTATNSHTPTTTEFQADDITEATADHYNGRIVIFTSGALTGQATSISDYVVVGGIGQFTVVALTEAPANNDTFIIL